VFSKGFNEVLGGDVLNGVAVFVDEGDVLLKSLVKPNTPISNLLPLLLRLIKD
jgi:hypothetical protein